jgi:hypothetical protein
MTSSYTPHMVVKLEGVDLAEKACECRRLPAAGLPQRNPGITVVDDYEGNWYTFALRLHAFKGEFTKDLGREPCRRLAAKRKRSHLPSSTIPLGTSGRR